METVEENERLTRVGRGTPMGELLRRYWWPVATTGELAEQPTKAVRILGESLVLYRDRTGNLGLVASRCAHRSFNLGVYAIPEEDGLRCPYHGWLYGADGQCLETPPEPRTSTFKDRVRITAYPAEELGGLIFAYLGPQPQPLLPRWDLLAMENVFRSCGQAVIPCNWLQCMENSVDTVHVEYLHGRMYEDVLHRQGKPITPQIAGFKRHHERFEFKMGPHGIIKTRLLEGQSEEEEDWKYGHTLVFPGHLRLGSTFGPQYSFQWRIPLDDEHTWHLHYEVFEPGPGVEVPKQDAIPTYETPLADKDGKPRFDYILAQDLVGWWSQGAIADRSIEKLAEADRGLIMFRHLLKEQMDVVSRGGDPMNVFRDPAQNAYIKLGLVPDSERPAAGARRHGPRIWGNGPTGDFNPALAQIADLFDRADAQGAAAGD